MELEEVLNRFLKDEVFIPLLLATTTVIVIVVRSVAGVIKSVARERTRREIAAFIAEGSMSPEQGERLMKVGRDHEG